MRGTSTTLFCAVAICALVAGPVAGQVGTWTSLAPLPVATEGHVTAGVDNCIYVIAGHAAGDTNAVWIYDIETDTWSSGMAAPTVRAELGGAAHDGFIYVVGGRPVLPGTSDQLERYDTVTDTWVTLSPMPTPRAGLGVAIVGNTLYAIGGRTGDSPRTGTPLSVVEAYDIATDTWYSVAPLPVALMDIYVVATHSGNIYVAGGYDGTFVVSTLYVYDPPHDSWSQATSMSVARGAPAMAASQGRIFVVGGFDQSSIKLSDVEVYNISRDFWAHTPSMSPVTPMPTPRAEMGAVIHGGRLYVPGGGMLGISTAANEMLNLSTVPRK